MSETEKCSEECFERLVNVIKSFNLPTVSRYSASELAELMKNDKKRKGDMITIVVSGSIGCAELMDININNYEKLIEFGVK